ncbi:uncharacterized protein LOC130753429 isoform X2 [Actinidia eriantha]|uniref:uncharacterized protein LOC130753429 isoform X2 n=1 Tax=Actinidia eriantha TaxID=165200 RepID=UPI00258704EC|nr:uncharacterized protein LOC130753429 isoform X2 [Actinidia eriantha]
MHYFLYLNSSDVGRSNILCLKNLGFDGKLVRNREEAVMERTSAACAMEWSIDLEKGLRSKNPGQTIKAILEIGRRLEQWDREPAINIAQHSMFGLILGEDKLFANSIFLRLTDAFSSGDKNTQLFVVKVFLSLLRNCRKRKGRHDSILFKCSSEHRSELLRRVKFVFDTGDVESKALALVLFGCWADVAKDSADIRYIVLSSLVSSDFLQVEASLFAGGCFCELSDDFASVLLEILVNLVTSSDTLSTAKLAGVRAFAKMGCSSLHANKAYKTGLTLVSESSEEDFLVAMLPSLSKLAVRSACLVPGQVSLLLSFLTQEKPFHLQATALKCLHYIIVKGMFHFLASAISVKTLVSILDESKFSPALQCGALQILREVLLHNLPTMSCTDMLEFSKILAILENATQSDIMAKRLLAIRVLVDISGTVIGRKEKALDGVDSTTLASSTISFVIDRIGLLVKLVDLHQLDSEIEREGQSLLGLLLLLIEKYPDLGGMVLDKICLLVEYLVHNHDRVTGTAEPNLSGNEIIMFRGQNSKFLTSKLLLCVSRVAVACLENLNEAGTVTTQVLDTLECLVKHLRQCSLFNCFTYTVYTTLLNSHITYCFMLNEIEKNDNHDRNLSISLRDYVVEQEILGLDCAKNMLERNDNWSAYKVGKYAACQGAWFTAAFTFEHLGTMVKSNTYYWWLKSLVQFANSERKVQLLNLSEHGFSLVNWSEINKTAIIPFRNDLGEGGQGRDWKLSLPNNVENLIEACKSLRSSVDTMGAIVTSGRAVCFQRWFLSLRAKVLESVADTLKLHCVPFAHDSVTNEGQVECIDVVESPGFLQWVTSVACSLTQISSRLNRLAREFDLIVTSFRGMDKKSLDIISAHALGCSLLAFSTGFSLFFPGLHMENILGMVEECLHGMLIQDLVWRLHQIDSETSTKLGFLWKVCRWPKNSFLQPGNQILSVGSETRCFLTVCNYAVTGVIALHKEDNRVHVDDILHQVTKDGLQLLLEIITKWMLIPFRTPDHFFRVRPCISSELFALNSDSRSQEGLSILPGFHLSLNLCLQLKNMPPDLQLTKLYCILYCKTSFQVPDPEANKGQKQLDYRDWRDDDMLYLNDKLLWNVTQITKKSSNTWHRHKAGDCGVVEIFASFEPNEKGQGFSTCLLDVSAFPLGSYRIKWHSCCVDNEGSYWSLLPLNADPVFTVWKKS